MKITNSHGIGPKTQSFWVLSSSELVSKAPHTMEPISTGPGQIWDGSAEAWGRAWIQVGPSIQATGPDDRLDYVDGLGPHLEPNMVKGHSWVKILLFYF